MTASSNYRVIAGGCLLLKLIDTIIIMIDGNQLKLDNLQFAYQKGSGTMMSTWLATSVISHYNQRGQNVFGATMDMSKALDMIDWFKLYETLLKRKIKAVFLRVLMFIYEHQTCQVKWGGSKSRLFKVQTESDKVESYLQYFLLSTLMN